MRNKSKKTGVCQTKYQFLAQLERSLKNLSPLERADTLNFYDEIISDKIEAGQTEQQAVASLGSIVDIKMQAAVESAQKSLDCARPKSAFKTFFVVLAACTSPVPLAIGLTLAVVMLSLVVSFGSVGLGLAAGSLYAMLLSLTNTYYLVADGNGAAAAMSFFACLFVAALLALLAVLFIKLTIKTVRVIAKIFVKLVKRKSEKRTDSDSLIKKEVQHEKLG